MLSLEGDTGQKEPRDHSGLSLHMAYWWACNLRNERYSPGPRAVGSRRAPLDLMAEATAQGQVHVDMSRGIFLHGCGTEDDSGGLRRFRLDGNPPAVH